MRDPSRVAFKAACLAGWAARTTRLPRGRNRLARILQAWSPDHEFRYSDRWGHRHGAWLGDEMQALGFVGLHEPTAAALNRLAVGDWVIDVGANVGLTTSALCSRVGGSGSVWAVEPVAENVERLEQLKADNDLDCLSIFSCAVGAHSGTASLSIAPRGRSGWASFTKSWGAASMVDVTVSTLDDLVKAHPHPPRLRLLKLDVEGFEPEVLVGAQRTLEQLRPLVLCEFNDILLRDSGSSAELLLQKFRDLGYSVAAASAKEASHLNGRVIDLLLEPSA